MACRKAGMARVVSTRIVARAPFPTARAVVCAASGAAVTRAAARRMFRVRILSSLGFCHPLFHILCRLELTPKLFIAIDLYL